jgi:hypothetical protein
MKITKQQIKQVAIHLAIAALVLIFCGINDNNLTLLGVM